MTGDSFQCVLEATGHRPWPVPQQPWAMRMRWRWLVFLHWPVDPGELAAALPAPLEPDVFDGWAWLGIVPFAMTEVAPRGLGWLTRLTGTDAFAELNVRTYVTLGGKAGVYFFSLDAESRLAVEAARAGFGLNYLTAAMRCQPSASPGDRPSDVAAAGQTASGEAEPAGGWVHYHSRRTDGRAPAAELSISYRPTGPAQVAEPGSLDAFLTERYCLYAVTRRGRVYRGEIHHRPWPLQPAEARIDTLDMTRSLGLALDGPPHHVRYADPLEVVAWRARRVRL